MDAARLRSIWLVAGLSDDELERLARGADEVAVGPGERLVDQGRFAYELFAIEEVTAEVVRDGARLAELGPGDFFGEIGLLESERRTASVVATSPMRVIVITGSAFKHIEREAPHLAAQVRKAIQDRLARSP